MRWVQILAGLLLGPLPAALGQVVNTQSSREYFAELADPVVLSAPLKEGGLLEVRYESNPVGSPIRRVDGHWSSDILVQVRDREGELDSIVRFQRSDLHAGSTPVGSALPVVRSVSKTEADTSVHIWLVHQLGEAWCHQLRLPDLAIQRTFRAEPDSEHHSFFEGAHYVPTLGFLTHWSGELDRGKREGVLVLYSPKGERRASADLPQGLEQFTVSEEDGEVFLSSETVRMSVEVEGERIELIPLE